MAQGLHLGGGPGEPLAGPGGPWLRATPWSPGAGAPHPPADLPGPRQAHGPAHRVVTPHPLGTFTACSVSRAAVCPLFARSLLRSGSPEPEETHVPSKFKMLLPAATLATLTVRGGLRASCRHAADQAPRQATRHHDHGTDHDRAETLVPGRPGVGARAGQPDRSALGHRRRRLLTVVIGGVAYVGGVFQNAISPTGARSARQNLAAFCLADGSCSPASWPTSTTAPGAVRGSSPAACGP